MNDHEIRQKFNDRLDDHYNNYIQDLQGCGSHELIARADEIASTQKIYKFLKDNKNLDIADVEYLRCLKNPFGIIRDGLKDMQDGDFESDLCDYLDGLAMGDYEAELSESMEMQ